MYFHLESKLFQRLMRFRAVWQISNTMRLNAAFLQSFQLKKSAVSLRLDLCNRSDFSVGCDKTALLASF